MQNTRFGSYYTGLALWGFTFALTILNQSLNGPSQAGSLGLSTPPGVPGASVMSI